MAKVKSLYPEPVYLPAYGSRLVLPGQVVEVPDDDAYGFTQQATWQAADKATKDLHAEREADYEERLAEVDGIPVELVVVTPDADSLPEQATADPAPVDIPADAPDTTPLEG